jgi:hypothetical protein
MLSSETKLSADGSLKTYTYSYDENGKRSSYLSSETKIDENGKKTTCNYSSSGSKTGCAETYADKYGNQYTNTYDGEGNLLSSTSDMLKIYTLPEAYAATADNSTNNFLIRYR